MLYSVVQIFATMLLASHMFCFVGAQPRDFLQRVNAQDLANDVQSSISDLLQGHASPEAEKKLMAIEARLWTTFQSLPKNSLGHIAPRAIRYIVHRYFAAEHGWRISGLEQKGLQANESSTSVHDVDILQEKAPLLVEKLLEARHQDRGLPFSEVVIMVSVLEHLIVDESVTLLSAAYRLNYLSTAETVDESSLHLLLQSFLDVFGKNNAELHNATYHQMRINYFRRIGRWHTLREELWERDAVSNFEYAQRQQANPFKPRQYSFAMASEIASGLIQQYGKSRDLECLNMKTAMARFDVMGTGRVSLGQLHAHPDLTPGFYFGESADYLRKIGALDETTSTPQVLIANYMVGATNCIEASSYYQICCLNACDSIMNEIEQKVLAPTASPEQLLGLAQNISRSISHGQPARRGLAEKLQSIAEHHNGEVPLHGRLFAQWLHFAFPHDCPYPSITESSDFHVKSQWTQRYDAYDASEEEIQNHKDSVDDFALDAEDVEIDKHWSTHEVVVEHHQLPSSSESYIALVVRSMFQLSAVFFALRGGLTAWRSATRLQFSKGSKKNDDLVLGDFF